MMDDNSGGICGFIGKYQVTLLTRLVALRSPAFSPFGPAPGRRWLRYHGLEIWEYVFAHECLARGAQELVKYAVSEFRGRRVGGRPPRDGEQGNHES
jgi:hypothetical protein